MLLIIEIAMLIGGIYAIVSAKIPSFLVGGGKYQIEGMTARAGEERPKSMSQAGVLPFSVRGSPTVMVDMFVGVEDVGHPNIPTPSVWRLQREPLARPCGDPSGSLVAHSVFA